MKLFVALAIASALLLGACAATPGGAGDTPRPTTDTAVNSPEATPSPAATAVADRYFGLVVFGTAQAADKLNVKKVAASFSRKIKAIAWTAHFTEPAGTTKVTILLLKTGSGGSEQIVDQETYTVSPDWSLLGSKGDIAGVLGHKAGTYVMRVVHGDTVLAEGKFQLR